MSEDLGTMAIRAVDQLTANYGGTNRHRAAHAKGFCVTGTFEPTKAAGDICRAEHFHRKVPVTVRFSNGSGNLGAADHHVDGRGMAVKFHLPGGGETDIVSLTQSVFFVRTPADFLELTTARRPDPATGRADPHAIGTFMIRHPESERALVETMTAAPAASFAQLEFHAIHAFLLRDEDGHETAVRYHWRPETGAAALTREEAKQRGPDHLRPEMAARLDGGPVAYRLELEVAEPGDDLNDPTAGWPDERRRITAGHLELTALSDEENCEPLVFDPTRLTDGIKASDDPILNFRPLAYSVSIERRLAADQP
ncbi:MAG: catalase family peroxidase [Candidatus Dormibacteraceae bacterium]